MNNIPIEIITNFYLKFEIKSINYRAFTKQE